MIIILSFAWKAEADRVVIGPSVSQCVTLATLIAGGGRLHTDHQQRVSQ